MSLLLPVVRRCVPRLAHSRCLPHLAVRRCVPHLNRIAAAASFCSQPESVMATKVPMNAKGEFVKPDSAFRSFVTVDGSSGFPPAAGRYHLYVSLACPWAHRTLLARALKGLEDTISITVVDWLMGEEGWRFTDKKPGCQLDTLNNKDRLREIYQLAVPGYDGRASVPVLWDKEKKTVVSNESAEILRMIGSGVFNAFSATPEQAKLDLYPEPLRKQIDDTNDWVYLGINNGVYRAGFATQQEAYDKAVGEVFEALDKVEGILSKQHYLCGDRFTEADVRLFTTLARFDSVYVGLFKCNKKRIEDYPNLWAFTREVYQMPGVAATVNLDHIRKHYQVSLKNLNPNGIVSIGPNLNFDEPHGREKFPAAK